MASDIPWSVNGIEPEAQEAAKMAARRQGVPVGQWLTHTILTAAAQELKHQARRSDRTGGDRASSNRADDRSDPEDPNAADLVTRSQRAFDRTYTASEKSLNGRSGPPALTPEAILESIQKLANRVEESENRTSDAIAPLADRIANLDSQIGEIKDRAPVGTAPVERAMMRLTERLEKLESEKKKSAAKPGLAERLFRRG